MPVARIYASLVEESESLCGDLLARGYNVEVVFPDAMLPTVADLELRVERCSAEQAIARVEAAGSPSRCVCITSAIGPRQELLMVEMTVPSAGTRGRHPMTVPTLACVGDVAASISIKPVDCMQKNAAPAALLPLPAVAQEPLSAREIPQNDSALGHDGHISAQEQDALSHCENEIFGKNEIAELNSFLAHAPRVERPEMLALKLLENLRHWKGFEREHERWQVLSLLAGACSLFLLLSLGWVAATSHSRIAGMLPATPASTRATVPNLATPKAPAQHLRGRRAFGVGDGLIAQDRIVRIDGILASKLHPQPSATNLIQPATIKPTTIKRISDFR